MSAPHDPGTTTAAGPDATSAAPAPAAKRGWKDRLSRGRRPLVAGATVAALALGGAGFGAGYAVGGAGVDDSAPSQVTGTDQDGTGLGGPPPDGRMGGGPGGPMNGQTDPGTGDTGEAPDFDGDGQPDDSTSTPDADDQQS